MRRRTTARVTSDLGRVLDEAAPVAGDRLPPERDLARRLGCSRETLRKALAELERSGELWRHVGQGTFRGPRPRHLSIRETLLIEGATPPDVMCARIMVEPRVAAEAARLAGASDVAYLRVKVADGRSAPDRAACERTDDAFHRALAQVAANPVIIGVLAYLSGARRRVAWQREWDRTYRRIGAEEFRTVHSDQHDRIVDGIELGDERAASTAMETHLETIEAAMSVQRT